MQTADDIISGILRREGGFSDNPLDRGAATYRGITLKTLQSLRPGATVQELRDLTESEIRDIYVAIYIHRPGFDRIESDALRALVVDCAVLHGPGRAAKWYASASGLTTPADVYCEVLALRCQFIGRLITDDPKQAVFAAGWANRQAEFIRAAAEV